MLDQDTARALLTVADECRARVALLGDRHQLPAVGRGGVLDLAAGQVDPAALPDPGGGAPLHPHRRRPGATVAGPRVRRPDPGHARRRAIPGAVFDALLARGQIQLHPDAGGAAGGAGRRSPPSTPPRPASVARRGRHPRAGRRAQRRHPRPAGRRRPGRRHPGAVTTGRGSGSAPGTGSPPAATTATSTSPTATPGPSPPSAGRGAGRRPSRLSPRPRRHQRGCRPRAVSPRPAWGSGCCPPATSPTHVELAYASTAHGVQGDTVTAAHLVIGEHTGAASAYVGMTRGRAGQHRPPGRRRRRPRRGSSGSPCSPATAPTSAPPTPPQQAAADARPLRPRSRRRRRRSRNRRLCADHRRACGCARRRRPAHPRCPAVTPSCGDPENFAVGCHQSAPKWRLLQVQGQPSRPAPETSHDRPARQHEPTPTCSPSPRPPNCCAPPSPPSGTGATSAPARAASASAAASSTAATTCTPGSTLVMTKADSAVHEHHLGYPETSKLRSSHVPLEPKAR